MLSETDALFLKLALERRLLDPASFARVRQAALGGERVAQALRAAGVSGKEVGVLVELAMPRGEGDESEPRARADVENVLVGRALLALKLASQPDIERAQRLVDEAALREGLFYSVAEVLVQEGRVDLLAATNLRAQAQSRIATCPQCNRHYLLPQPGRSGCRPCQVVIQTGVGLTASDAWRAGQEVRPPSGRFDAVPDSAEPPPELLISDPDLQVADIGASLVIADDLADSVQELSATFGSYTIMSEIDRGANGVVYRAKPQGSEQVVALKVLLGGPKASEQQRARFEREAQVGRRLRHPGIAATLDYGVHQGQPYMAMELAEGETLESRLLDAPLGGEQAAGILAQVARAVHYLHGEGVIHRDLKPENVIVDSSDRAKLIDLGLAKTNSDVKLTADASTLGTPAYMSPEQVQGQSDKVTPAADVYGLGAVLYATLTGRPPFEGQNYMDLFRKIVEEEPPPPSRLIPTPPALDAVVLRCLAKSPGARYSSAADLADDLEAVVAGEAVSIPVAAAKASSSLDANKVLLGVLVLLLVLIFLAVVALFLIK